MGPLRCATDQDYAVSTFHVGCFIVSHCARLPQAMLVQQVAFGCFKWTHGSSQTFRCAVEVVHRTSNQARDGSLFISWPLSMLEGGWWEILKLLPIDPLNRLLAVEFLWHQKRNFQLIPAEEFEDYLYKLLSRLLFLGCWAHDFSLWQRLAKYQS